MHSSTGNGKHAFTIAGALLYTKHRNEGCEVVDEVVCEELSDDECVSHAIHDIDQGVYL